MKRVFFSLILLSFILLIAGCGYTKEEKAYMKKLEKQASENAINYIKNKYGFSADIISSEVEKYSSSGVPFSSDLTGDVYVKLKYKDKKFIVYISGENVNIDGKDNYQYDEIVSDILNLIETKTNIKPHNSSIYYGKDYKNEKGLISKLYNNNINEVVKDNNFRIQLEYINIGNLEYIKNNNLLTDMDYNQLILINYHSLESYNNKDINNYYLTNEDYLLTNAVNIESACIIKDNNIKYYKFNLKSIDDIYYYTEPDNYLNLSYTTISDAKNWIGRDAFKNVKQVSNAYLTNSNSSLYIYIPTNKIKGYDIENIDIGIECESNLDKKFYTISGNLVENYFVYKLKNFYGCNENSDVKFTLLYSTPEE